MSCNHEWERADISIRTSSNQFVCSNCDIKGFVRLAVGAKIPEEKYNWNYKFKVVPYKCPTCKGTTEYFSGDCNKCRTSEELEKDDAVKRKAPKKVKIAACRKCGLKVEKAPRQGGNGYCSKCEEKRKVMYKNMNKMSRERNILKYLHTCVTKHTASTTARLLKVEKKDVEYWIYNYYCPEDYEGEIIKIAFSDKRYNLDDSCKAENHIGRRFSERFV